jgi:hypothetical protein
MAENNENTGPKQKQNTTQIYAWHGSLREKRFKWFFAQTVDFVGIGLFFWGEGREGAVHSFPPPLERSFSQCNFVEINILF